MEIIESGFDGLFILKPRIFEDERGYFFESYNKSDMQKNGLNYDFIQDNQSKSLFGIIRGLHYQLEPYAQTKLVRVLSGSIFDVAVDIRKGSPTFGQWYGLELSDVNKYQLLIPKGFAHGFSVLSTEALVSYKTDNYYNPGSERGIIYFDMELGIDWKLDPKNILVSDRDMKWPDLQSAEMNFSFPMP